MKSPKNPKIRGTTAPPAIDDTKNAAPVLVNLPKSTIERGQIAGQISEQANAISITHQIENSAGVTTIRIEVIKPIHEHILNAPSWLKYLGIRRIPRIYPITIPILGRAEYISGLARPRLIA